jgi:hypothetical protein
MKVFSIKTVYAKHKHKKKMKYILSDLKFLIITFSVIMIWRGFRNFLDNYFLTEYFVISNVLSIMIWVSFILMFKIHFDAKDIKF